MQRSTDYHSSIINTRAAQSPRSGLGNSWSFPSDVGLGCMAMELLTGRLLFQTHDSFEHLALMQCLCGNFPIEMIKVNKEAIVKGTGRNEVHDFFSDDHVLRYPVKGRNNGKANYTLVAKRVFLINVKKCLSPTVLRFHSLRIFVVAC